MSRHSEGIRLRNLHDQHPYCFWCGCRTYRWPLPEGQRQPGNHATLDHLNSRTAYPDGRPRDGITVLACRDCNQDRATAEQAGEYWLPPLMARRRIPG